MKKLLAAAAAIAAASMLAGNAHAYGAIAVDHASKGINPAYGFSTGASSRQAAERIATAYCSERGRDCKPVVWFETCGAYANSRTHYGYGYGANKADATAKALKMCGSNQCEVVVAKCQ
ncbi:MAG: DUF4189 domain-containing protein [Burkholderiales bacterium]